MLKPHDDVLLDRLQWETFEYFLKEVNPANGLIADKTRDDWPASIAATGLALAAYPIGVERGFMTREDAIRITLTTLQFFRNSAQGAAPDTTGHKGFYYHFLDMKTGRRAWRCEISTIDTAFLLAGALTAAATSIAMLRTSIRSERWLTSYIAVPIGDGRSREERRSRTDGSRKRASSPIGGRAMTRRCSSTTRTAGASPRAMGLGPPY